MIQLSDAEILYALERILKSETFTNSNRLQAFLRYVVVETLSGRERSLKAYTIATEVFGRTNDFDPQTDSIVRVQARNLRQHLEQYYAAEGKDDPVIIKIPSGHYVPQFQSMTRELVRENRDSIEHKNTFNQPKSIVNHPVIAVLLIGFAIFLIALLGRYATEADSVSIAASFVRHENQQSNEYGAHPSMGPSLAILTFQNSSTDDPLSSVNLEGLSLAITEEISRFKDLYILGHTGVGRLQNYQDAQNLGIDYALSGAAGIHDGHLNVFIQLVDVSTRQVLWSKSFQHLLDIGKTYELQREIARSVAITVGQPYGVINRWEARKIAQLTDAELNSYQCLLGYYGYSEKESRSLHLKLRSCLENSTQRDPSYARIWAVLSWLYGDEVRHGYNSLPKSRERALEAALKAVDLDPYDAFNHQYLANAYSLQGNIREAKEHIDSALILNPNDSDVLADAAWNYTLFEQWDKAETLIKRAMALNPSNPPWYHLAILYINLARHDYAEAFNDAKSMIRPGNNQAQLLITSVAALADNVEQAHQHAEILRSEFPATLINPEEFLRNMLIPEALVNELLKGLSKAGIDTLKEGNAKSIPGN